MTELDVTVNVPPSILLSSAAPAAAMACTTTGLVSVDFAATSVSALPVMDMITTIEPDLYPVTVHAPALRSSCISTPAQYAAPNSSLRDWVRASNEANVYSFPFWSMIVVFTSTTRVRGVLWVAGAVGSGRTEGVVGDPDGVAPKLLPDGVAADPDGVVGVAEGVVLRAR